VLSSLEIIRDWYRSGAETYGLRFAVVTGSGQRRAWFMKACVAYGGGVPLVDIFAEWLSRRAAVERMGISTPKLYAVGPALLVEEFIPHTLRQALAQAHDRSGILASVGATAAYLINAGFAPLSAHDWRSRGNDVVLIDFGQDLGPANFRQGSETGLLSEVLHELASVCVELSDTDFQLLGTVYEHILNG